MNNHTSSFGSFIAKNGFLNEKEVAQKLNDYIHDRDAQIWLIIMGYDLNKIKHVKANVLSGYKADVNVIIQIKMKQTLDSENLQVKLVSNLKGFNQIDKRKLRSYQEMWNIPPNIYQLFAYFAGELKPTRQDIKYPNKRMLAHEFTNKEQQELLAWLNDNKMLIVSDILKGRGEFSAEWVLVIQKINLNMKWALKNINEVMQHYFDDGIVEISKKGSLKIGRITIQRKGGDNGRESANMLQFKIDPTELLG
ncbi:PDDEXK family nuclease [Helicobacter pylori]|uniref:type II restriction endonuclease n=1 Tax=Helicobacter pylori TaxID=210 RepID=UPI002711ECC6|nr:type II restriction endonuclease [Helicobacter pylori]MDO7814987.1 type II restriction endonuclease [Helicobacter pylori]MDO7819475.1 type II restriction endonuclease [Helicobacter pylori]MDO7828009.1 type II restriction endonuclease [Helicobacter pylori]MDO7865831.1 type II restriction endonuclease [Helicobacter pylori]WQU17117.1 type II restriction endonuclease [Helicobacter pylori]